MGPFEAKKTRGVQNSLMFPHYLPMINAITIKHCGEKVASVNLWVIAYLKYTCRKSRISVVAFDTGYSDYVSCILFI